MSDVFEERKRSEVMGKIRGRGNKTTEMVLVAAFKKFHITGWRRHVRLPIAIHAEGMHGNKPKRAFVTPDFIFRKQRIALFVDGCFWHCCPLHSKMPTSNNVFWTKKLLCNVERDKRTNAALTVANWTVIRIWEHELKEVGKALEKLCVLL
jgi:DNA mismatch endonuclease (patch repair protein)